MFDKLLRLIAVALLAVFVYFHARQAEVGRFQSWPDKPVLVDTRTGRVYMLILGKGTRLIGDVADLRGAAISTPQPGENPQAAPPPSLP